MFRSNRALAALEMYTVLPEKKPSFGMAFDVTNTMVIELNR